MILRIIFTWFDKAIEINLYKLWILHIGPPHTLFAYVRTFYNLISSPVTFVNLISVWLFLPKALRNFRYRLRTCVMSGGLDTIFWFLDILITKVDWAN